MLQSVEAAILQMALIVGIKRVSIKRLSSGWKNKGREEQEPRRHEVRAVCERCYNKRERLNWLLSPAATEKHSSNSRHTHHEITLFSLQIRIFPCPTTKLSFKVSVTVEPRNAWEMPNYVADQVTLHHSATGSDRKTHLLVLRGGRAKRL